MHCKMMSVKFHILIIKKDSKFQYGYLNSQIKM